jgi:hypothetical protein
LGLGLKDVSSEQPGVLGKRALPHQQQQQLALDDMRMAQQQLPPVRISIPAFGALGQVWNLPNI